ncbi:NYN domain-containing protein [Natronosporangium hydrolyticum]|uniref:NYN domain-containing protein n=1 Tax=Natronosporangium hydrolyticum TaxID=2811111 RepID=A0A895YFI8_9ACTN|nr:NYN domain-containing protein [Natronosporangium hydrolyticum]QSB14219.1 NYN domain-containing protein [Natronosporangium hydrolyticum]
MRRVRAALYLDFDNVFGGMLKLDPDVAIQFATEPGSWLGRLSESFTIEGPRRWLVLRCYMNPAGWVPHPHPHEGAPPRLYFSRFRPLFTRAGFEVVDCPPLTYSKNAADIRMVVDAIDALASEVTYEEFVIASGDSDMTPLLTRLRRADRRTTILAASEAGEALTAVADRLVDSGNFLALVQGEQLGLGDEETDIGDRQAASAAGDTAKVSAPAEPPAGFDQFRSLIEGRYRAASGPLNLATLAHEIRRELGASLDGGDWFGVGSFVRALRWLDLPGAQFSQHYLWDTVRHEAPGSGLNGGGHLELPDPVARLVALLGLPKLPQRSWLRLYQALADYAGSHRFNLTECTRWCRDQLVEQGIDVSRSAVSFVTRGASFGGCPLHRRPPPTAEEIAAAFLDNVLNRAESQDIGLNDEEAALVRAWLGGGLEMSVTE